MTDALQISTLDGPMGSTLGLANCPGRKRSDRLGRVGNRDLEQDLQRVEDWGADILLTLVESHEFDSLGVPDLPAKASRRRFRWHHLPVKDFDAPGPDFAAAWIKHGPEIMATIRAGGRIVIHCAAGRGRTGTIAAKILIAFGATADAAIDQVRQARPGAIEAPAQEIYLRHGPDL